VIPLNDKLATHSTALCGGTLGNVHLGRFQGDLTPNIHTAEIHDAASCSTSFLLDQQARARDFLTLRFAVDLTRANYADSAPFNFLPFAILIRGHLRFLLFD